MIDIVYPLGTGSRWANNEIKYSLRSVDKHFRAGRICIVGEQPQHINPSLVWHIPCPENGGNKEWRIMWKILTYIAKTHGGDGDYFLFMNDDHFLLQNFNLVEFPFFYEGTLEDLLETGRYDGVYKVTIEETIRVLKEAGLPTLNFDIHTPIIYNSKAFEDCMRRYDWNNAPAGFLIKSLYCNTVGVQPTLTMDCKIRSALNKHQIAQQMEGCPVLSIDDGAVNIDMIATLESLYPKPSRWEIH